MARRDRHDIMLAILAKAKSGKRKTELMKEVSLSFKQTNQYLRNLTEKGLLEVDKDRYIRTTRKGLETLEKCSHCTLFPWKTGKG
jgi:predicted transcriptional regulator